MSAARAAVLIAVAAFGLRVLALVLFTVLDLGGPLGFYRVERSGGLEWDWGYEQAAIAQSIAEGRGFSDPFLEGTGPTAWASPFYPLLLGGLIKVFGGITAGVAWTLAIVQCLAAGATSFFLWRLGRDLYSSGAGLAAAVLWAVHPMAIYLPISLVWDSTIVALSITWLLSAVIERGRDARLASVFWLGAGLGLTLLVNPAPLGLVPMLAWYYLRPRGGRFHFERTGIARVAALTGGALLAASPWIARNVAVLQTAQLRSNLGVEVMVGNNDGAIGVFNGELHPAYSADEVQRLRALGEVDYSREALHRGLDWISDHPARFGRLTLERFQRFWFGPDPTQPLVLGSGDLHERDWMGWLKWLTHAVMGALAIASILTWRGRPGSRAVIGGALLFFPLVYYVTHVFERYRFPIEPLITLAAAVFLLRLVFARTREWARPNGTWNRASTQRADTSPNVTST